MKKFVPVHSLAELREGDIVRGVLSGNGFVVCSNYGDHVTAVRVQDITQPGEWLVWRDVVDPIAAAVDAHLDALGDQVKAFGHTLAKCVTCGQCEGIEALAGQCEACARGDAMLDQEAR